LLQPQGADPHMHIGECDPIFESYTDFETGKCIRKHRALLSDEEPSPYFATVLETFKLNELEVVTIDSNGNALVYHYDELYEIVL